MSTSELQLIIDSLNAKKYTQNSGRAEFEIELTDIEKSLITRYEPQKSFIIYGSLAPGRPNHSKVEMIKGTWRQGTVSGKLESKGWGADLGYNGFLPTSDGEQIEISAYVLTSNELANYWSVLDEFEGEGYQRILAPYTLKTGEVGVGHIYALKEDVVK